MIICRASSGVVSHALRLQEPVICNISGCIVSSLPTQSLDDVSRRSSTVFLVIFFLARGENEPPSCGWTESTWWAPGRGV